MSSKPGTTSVNESPTTSRCRGRRAETGRDFRHRCCRLGSEAVQSLKLSVWCGLRSYLWHPKLALLLGSERSRNPIIYIAGRCSSTGRPRLHPLKTSSEFGSPGILLGSGDFVCGFVPLNSGFGIFVWVIWSLGGVWCRLRLGHWATSRRLRNL